MRRAKYAFTSHAVTSSSFCNISVLSKIYFRFLLHALLNLTLQSRIYLLLLTNKLPQLQTWSNAITILCTLKRLISLWISANVSRIILPLFYENEPPPPVPLKIKLIYFNRQLTSLLRLDHFAWRQTLQHWIYLTQGYYFTWKLTSLLRACRFAWRQTLQSSQLFRFPLSWSPALSVHCNAADIKFSLIIQKERYWEYFPATHRLMWHLVKTLLIASRSYVGWASRRELNGCSLMYMEVQFVRHRG
jgi:hypothetical protein